MSGQRTSSIGGAAESVAAGCVLRELRPKSRRSGSSHLNYGNGSSNNSTALWGEDAGLAVFTWGRGEDGQLGLGDTSDQDEPTYVDALRGVGVRQIACGSGHTVVLTTDGEVYTWGTCIFYIFIFD
jgi:alpha-tubulin suppressor-like RCC1 family protein